jgi:hypothetical protein
MSAVSCGVSRALGSIFTNVFGLTENERQKGRAGRVLGWGRSGCAGSPLRGGSAFEHSAGHRQEPVGDAAQCAPMRMTAGAQRAIARPASGVVLCGQPRPVIGRCAQPP